MKLIYKMLPIFLFMIFGLGFSSISSKVEGKTLPKLVKYEVNPPYKIKNRWVCIPKGEHEITVKVYGENITEMSFYLTPTGTQTEQLKKLIGKSSNKDGEFTITYKFTKDESILYHLSIIATNVKGERIKDTLFNFQRCD